MLSIERSLWRDGVLRLAGIDEAGRGPLAGPVVAAALVLDPDYAEAESEGALAGLTDSKQLSEQRRERYFGILTTCRSIDFGVGIVDAARVDEVNILNATHQAMTEAVDALSELPDFALVDGRSCPETMPCDGRAVVKGDQQSLSIAAASVIAKVTRDRMMVDFDAQYPQYGFAGHKGYGSRDHFEALMEHGPSPIHRMSFRPVRESARIRGWGGSPGVS